MELRKLVLIEQTRSPRVRVTDVVHSGENIASLTPAETGISRAGESESIELDDIFPPLFYVEPIVILGLPLRASRQNPNEAFHHATLRYRVTGNQSRHAAAHRRCTGVFLRGVECARLCLGRDRC